MLSKLRPAAVAACLAFSLLSAAVAHAATLDFTLNAAGSSVSATKQGAGTLCTLTACKFTAALALPTTTYTLGTGQSATFTALTFATSFLATGSTNYNIAATLAFGGSEAFSVSSTGSGRISTFLGSFSGGTLTWAAQPTTVTLADGSTVQVSFGTPTAFTGTSVTANVTLKALNIVTPPPPPSPVPLPASSLLLLGALGAITVTSRKRRASRKS